MMTYVVWLLVKINLIGFVRAFGSGPLGPSRLSDYPIESAKHCSEACVISGD